MAREFRKAVDSIANRAGLEQLARLIEAGDADAVVEYLGISRARFSRVAEAMREVYTAGAAQAELDMPRLRSDPYRLSGAGYGPTAATSLTAQFTFDLTNAAAAEWLTRRSSELITNVVESQRQLIRAALANGMNAGLNPRRTALELVGRIGSNGRRTGGLLGLTMEQAQYVQNMRAQLASGNPAAMRQYFSREMRDKRLDGIVKRAIAAGKRVDSRSIDKIAARYSDKLLKLRGDNIARTETIAAFNGSREEAYRQAIESGQLLAENVTGTWGATGDARTRESHWEMNGQERKFGEPFVSPSGARMLYPGDTSQGAGPEETINCRCMKQFRVDIVAEANRGR